MAHFAKLDELNIVTAVYVVNDENAQTEQDGINFLNNWAGEITKWKQCSYNNNIRKCFPGKGYSYDEVNDVFIAPQPYPSWTLNANFDWESPVSMPEDSQIKYTWDEPTLNWIPFTESSV